MEMRDVREKFGYLRCCEHTLADAAGSKISRFIAESRSGVEFHCQIWEILVQNQL